MDNVGIVVESLDPAISFFAELGLELEGRAMIEGDGSGRVTGLRDQRVEIAMMRTPDGHGPSTPLLTATLTCAAVGVALPYIEPFARLFASKRCRSPSSQSSSA
jgi:hypothetical protein